jgi:acetyltransferase-like isoleucine patch superfamily enzyme
MADTGPARGLSAADLSKALRSPSLLVQVARARWQLRACDVVPKTVRVRGRIFVQNKGRIVLGERVRFDGRVVPVDLAAWEDATLAIGGGTFLNFGASISAAERITIGEGCLIGNYVVIMDTDYHDLQDHARPGKSAPITIGDNVWLGTRVTVLKGVTIGSNSVIGAGSVVTSDIPEGSLAFGVPATVIKQL